MKRLVIFVLILSVVATYGQDTYRTFLEEGKVWNYRSYNYFTGNDYTFKLFVCGDTLIDGHLCKKIYQDSMDKYQYALYEEGQSIYIIRNGFEAKLLYDFSKKVGETINIEGIDIEVTKIDTVKVNNNYFRRFCLKDKDDDRTLIHWVEGIGGEFILEVPLPYTGNTFSFLSCVLNGDTLFSQRDFLMTNIVAPQGVTNCYNIYDLSGRHLMTPQRGINIICKPGRKAIKTVRSVGTK